MIRRRLSLDALKDAREAIDRAIQDTMHIMEQKRCMEGHVQLGIDIEVDYTDTATFNPRVSYKTSINVPVKVSTGGRINGLATIFRDTVNGEIVYMTEIEGEQMRLEDVSDV